MPWLDVKKEGIGFYKPKHLDGDVRYLSLNVTVDQQPTPEFTRLSVQERVSAMFSRYVPHLLRSMATSDLLKDSTLEGFTVIVSWLKAEPTGARTGFWRRPQPSCRRLWSRTSCAGEPASASSPTGSHVLAWDGEAKVGQIKPKAWADDFAQTYKVAGYTPDPKVSCN